MNNDLFGPLAPIRFVIFVSYGNDSIALVQWAIEQGLEDVALVFTNTGWAAEGWMERVARAERWARSHGMTCYRTSSVGFRQLARQKSGFPTQQFQWCSFILKIEPGQRWLAHNDPERRATCLVGVRREESEERTEFPEYLAKSENHGGRVMLAPLATFTKEQRDDLIRRSGFTVLPHRSRECKCINSNREDMRRFTERDWQDIADAEREIGRPMYRPARHMGAKGAQEVRRWANSARGKYVAPQPVADAVELEDAPKEFVSGCLAIGGCGS